jgi:hypothetical protein
MKPLIHAPWGPDTAGRERTAAVEGVPTASLPVQYPRLALASFLTAMLSGREARIQLAALPTEAVYGTGARPAMAGAMRLKRASASRRERDVLFLRDPPPHLSQRKSVVALPAAAQHSGESHAGVRLNRGTVKATATGSAVRGARQHIG